MSTTAELVAFSGITYRQADYWVRKEYLVPEDREKEKSGFPRSWTNSEMIVAKRMGALVAAGFVPEIAVQYARAEPGLVALTPFADLRLLE